MLRAFAMRARLLPAGDAAILVEVGGVEDVLALTAALRDNDSAVLEPWSTVPAATTPAGVDHPRL